MNDKDRTEHLLRLINLDDAQQVWADLEHIWRQAPDKAMAREAKKAAKYLGLLIDRREAADQLQIDAERDEADE